jgi:hypothetical protein
MKSILTLLPCVIALSTGVLAGDPDAKPGKIWTDPVEAAREDPDFAVQGEYAAEGVGVQVVALGAGSFDAWVHEGGLPGAGATGPRQAMRGARKDGRIHFTDEAGRNRAVIAEGTLRLEWNGRAAMKVARVERSSPTLGAKPPREAVVLFDGTDTTAWENGAMADGHLRATNCTTTRRFTSYKLHLEFRTPYMPSFRGQARGNSGIYHSGRWETQILDSFGLEGRDNECGGIYSISKPLRNMCLPPLSWQTYDVEFTAAKFGDDGKREAWPRITVRLNGELVHDDLELAKDFTTAAPHSTPLASPQGPVFIQDHGDPVVFRNVWIVPVP